jgi:hypothetical protein
MGFDAVALSGGFNEWRERLPVERPQEMRESA